MGLSGISGFPRRPGSGMWRALPGPSVPFLGPLQSDLPNPGVGERVETRNLEPPSTLGIHEDNNCL